MKLVILIYTFTFTCIFLPAQGQVKKESTTNIDRAATRKKIDSSKLLQMPPVNTSFQANCGITLIAPFLPSFFSRLNLTIENRWANTQAQTKAVHLLHYIMYGKETYSTYEIEKILCGLSFETAFSNTITLSETEKLEADLLLNTVIQQWQALKNISGTGFREAFLKRSGIIEKDGERWKVTIEKTSQDILLDSIPWSFSMISAPWNNYVVIVKW